MKKTMLAWMPMSVDGSSPTKQQKITNAPGMLYGLTVAFPAWAGAILAVYTIFLCRFGAQKIRIK